MNEEGHAGEDFLQGDCHAMTAAIRPDVHARFMTLVARAEAKVRSEEQAVQKRSARRPAAEVHERARITAGADDE